MQRLEVSGAVRPIYGSLWVVRRQTVNCWSLLKSGEEQNKMKVCKMK
jgi:hypothetical protein